MNTYDFRKKIWPLLLLTLAISVLIGIISFLNIWRNRLQLQEYKAEAIVNHIMNSQQLDEWMNLESAEAIYQTLTTDWINIRADELEGLFVYETDSGTGYPETDEVSPILDRIAKGKTVNYLEDEIYHIFLSYEKNDQTFIIHTQYGYQSEIASFRSEILHCLLYLLLGFLLLLLILSVGFRRIRKAQMQGVLFNIALFSWLTVFILLITLPFLYSIVHSQYDLVQKIYAQTEESLLEYTALREEGSLKTSILDNLEEGDLKTYIEDQSMGDPYLELVALGAYNNAGYSAFVREIEFDDNIWDDSLSIEDRVRLIYDWQTIYALFVEMLLQILMLVILAMVLVKCIRIRWDQTIIQDKQDPVYKGMVRMRRIIIGKCFVDSLTAVVSVPVLRRMVMGDFPLTGATVISWTISAVSFLGIVITVLIPYVRRNMGNSIIYFRVALFISVLGSLLCFFSKSSLVYVAGYLILAAGDALSAIVFLLYPLELPNRKQAFKIISFFTSGRLVGQIIGFLLSGLLAYLLGEKPLFLVIALLLLVIMGFSFLIPTDMLSATDMPTVSNWFRVFRMRKIQYFFFLMLIPFGFISYFFKFKVPLDVGKLGLTTTLISFLYFIRYVLLFYFKQSIWIKQFWKRFKPETVITVNMLQIALLFGLYCVFTNVLMLFLVTILLAFVQSKFSSYMSIYGFEAAGNTPENFFGNNTVRSIGNKLGTTIAPLLVSSIGLFTLPLIMGVCSLLHFRLVRKKEKQK